MDSILVLGLLKLRIKRGINLAIRDSRSSDPYIVVNMGEQKLRTHVVKQNCNPEWNEELTLSIRDVNTPIHLTVYDKDTFSVDDKMGEAEIDLKPYLECVKMAMELEKLPHGCAVKRIQPNRTNCLAEESSCILQNGNIIQDMILRLRNVERGEIVVQIEWIDVIGCKGLSEVEF
ncbi:protein C2-DOMAIN ABA-RELATED 9-like isoform X1 [Gastrolobium bilobum]|uniref:protein C2-DOMAIN ABA-RELATED 9-like isoform X1 n=1 Tax=Gastrolobium bilobum TaxID=150636 RepID=UPI002AB06AE2|nr:protein C2-DOMAIN ABA-RELATED 9-like isoform X1 [Gastrolobium bilobum]